ncbi:MAG: HAD-IC family P-type ATPase [Acidimicrobiaceae bacterium]|nr:HAD-IC family P-type ATPase [Acidimicrobiia bacterium]MCY4494430.1 HAD-IC family P-type ATPase [Acidimicrobiaceae bacterium]
MISGLTAAEVEQRVAEGLINDVPDAPVRSFAQIVKANVVTPVNGIIATLLALILIAGFPADALFAGVVVSNSVIGIAQELQARRTLNALAVLSAPKARVRRDGESSEIAISGVVADDVLELAPGDQVVVDGEVISALGLEIDESLLTGEADPVDKTAGSEVLSGSFVSAGSGIYRATRVGADAYAAKLSEDARRFELAHSELRRGVNVILRWLSFIIPPTALLLLARQLNALDAWQDALQGTVAAAVAMVPDGLVLLTSLSFVTGVIALARRRALAKELASVELLARVDTLCLDKTGTITTGEISLGSVEPLGSFSAQHAAEALGALAAADPAPNATLAAIAADHPAPHHWQLTESLPFSSARKWAAASFAGRGCYLLGAPDIVFGDGDGDNAERERAAEIAASGTRVLLVARSDEPWDDETLPSTVEGVALVHLEDTVRSDAPEILAFFRDQGVALKVISGDNPATVAAVARRAGIGGADSFVDGRSLPSEPADLADALEANTVFGRVTPYQKRAMVHALQQRGRTVAMTGDGVNDVLALKDADMGIAMGSGSSSTRAVAQLVLLDNKFSTLPRVLAEGRRVINNIERVANLFITKAAYAVLLTALVSIAGSPFPFLPRQLTLIGTFSIGVPGFFLALAKNDAVVRPGFLRRVLRFSLPAGLIAGAVTYVLYEVVRRMDEVSLAEARTASTATLLAIVLVILVLVSLPLKPAKIALPIAMTGVYLLTLFWSFPRDYFELDLPPSPAWLAVATASVIGSVAVTIATRLLDE